MTRAPSTATGGGPRGGSPVPAARGGSEPGTAPVIVPRDVPSTPAATGPVADGPPGPFRGYRATPETLRTGPQPVATGRHAEPLRLPGPLPPVRDEPARASRRARVVAAVRGRSVRTRIVVWVLVIATGGMLVAGTASYLVQRSRVDARIGASLQQEVDELRLFATQGIDPETGAAVTSTERFLEAAMGRKVPGALESYVALLDARVAFVTASTADVALEDYPELVQAAAALGPEDPVLLGRTESPSSEVAYAAVPVAVPGDPLTGVFVIGYDRGSEQRDLLDSYRTFTVMAAATLLLVALVSWLVASQLMRPVTLLRQTAQRITLGADLDERIPVRGHDDLSALARSFNDMLDRLQSVLLGQRVLLDDVGHELRTPITVVRGHIELMDPDDPGDVRSTRDLTLDELDRMHRLADDLVLLASAQQPDFLRWEVVDAGVLVEGVLEKARALADRAWELDAGASVPVAGDPHRLTQALLALVTNAVRVTAPGDVVALGCSWDADAVRLCVRDSGPGVAPEDRERIFDRFARGSTSTRDGGSGLGLAIVTAIAVAHGGRIDLESPPGEGATFTLVLPRAGAAGPADAGRGRIA